MKIDKPADTNLPLHPIIKNRWSPRSFSEKPIDAKHAELFFEAARWAASSMNEQPWVYYYAFRGDNAFKGFVDCLFPQNQTWAKNAAMLVLSCGRMLYSRNQKQNTVFLHDVGSANTSMLLQALESGIYGHMMGGFDAEKAKETFNLPADQQPVCFIALGYPDSPEKLEEPLKSRELAGRVRKPISEFSWHIKG